LSWKRKLPRSRFLFGLISQQLLGDVGVAGEDDVIVKFRWRARAGDVDAAALRTMREAPEPVLILSAKGCVRRRTYSCEPPVTVYRRGGRAR
jgi:hypothetical protein